VEELDAAVAQEAAKLTQEILDDHKTATSPEDSPLATMLGILKDNITEAAQAEIANALDRAKANASRTEATNKIHEFAGKKAIVKSLIAADNMGTDDLGKAALKSLDLWHVWRDWRIPTKKGLVELAVPAAIRRLARQIEQDPSIVGNLDDAGARVWINDAVQELLPEVLPDVMKELIDPVARVALESVAGPLKTLYSAHSIKIAQITHPLNHSAAKRGTLERLPGLTIAEISEKLEEVHGEDKSKALATVRSTATVAARNLYKGDLETALRRAALVANPAAALKSELRPILKGHREVVERVGNGRLRPTVERLEGGGERSLGFIERFTGGESEWKRDQRKIQDLLVQYAEEIVQRAVDKLEQDLMLQAVGQLPPGPLPTSADYVSDAEWLTPRDYRIDNADDLTPAAIGLPPSRSSSSLDIRIARAPTGTDGQIRSPSAPPPLRTLPAFETASAGDRPRSATGRLQRAQNAGTPSAPTSIESSTQSRRPEDDFNALIASKFVNNAIARNASQYNDYEKAPRGLSAPELLTALGVKRQLLEDLKKSIREDIATMTAAGVDIARSQPDVQQIIRDTARGAEFPDGDIVRQRNEIQRKILQTVNDLIPHPEYRFSTVAKIPYTTLQGERRVEYVYPTDRYEAVVNTVGKPLTAGRNIYNREVFETTMLPYLSTEMQAALAPAMENPPRADRPTVMLSYVPYGLSLIIGDFHSHAWPYDRRGGKQFFSLMHMLKAHGGYGRILYNGIPQFCGGFGHYSNSVPAPATMRGSTKLDDRLGDDWLELYHAGEYELAARCDISLSGMAFSAEPPLWPAGSRGGVLNDLYQLTFFGEAPPEAYTDPCAYLRRILRLDGIDYVADAELTIIKEQVSVALGGGWRWNIDSPKFLSYLELANETGRLLTIHCDWGDHTLSATGRPAPAKQNYEHFDKIISVLRQQRYRQVQVTLAHTGIGRFVRPNDPVTRRTHRIHTWVWEKDEQTGEVRGRITETRTKEVTAPEHIHKIYELFEAVPNARVDISWNEVTQALMDLLMDPNPAVSNSIFELFEDHADRILFGSDTVKPVDEFQYNQTLMTGSPLFAEQTRRDIQRVGGVNNLTKENSTAFKILRGNYDKAMDLGYTRMQNWKVRAYAQRPGDAGPEWQDPARPGGMIERQQNLAIPRQELLDGAWREFQDFAAKVDQIGISWSGDSPHFEECPDGIYPMLYRALPESTHMEQDAGSATGVGTSGGYNNDSKKRTQGANVLTGGIVAATAGLLYGGSKLWGPPGAGGAAADRVNNASFLVRAVVGLVRIFYTEKLRLEWEEIFEKGNVTREGLDQYVSRLFNGSDGLDLTAHQRLLIGAATEQFWANIRHLADQRIDFDVGYTDLQKIFDIQAKVGAYQCAMSRVLNVQDSTVDATDARRREGQIARLVLQTTHGINVMVGLQGLLRGDYKGLEALLHIPETAFHFLFVLGNATMGTRAARGLAGGLLKITDTDGGRWPHGAELAGTGLLAAGSMFWSAQDIIGIATNALHKEGGQAGVDTVTAILKAAFAFYMAQNSMSEFNRVFAREMRGPKDQAFPLMMVSGTLLLTMIIALAAGGYGATKA
jgi:hypothetical protein